MHSREPDLVDARALVESYIHFGTGTDAIPEFAHPIMIRLAAEALSIARKQEYETISAIANACSQSRPDTDTIAVVEQICQSRLDELSGILSQEALIETQVSTTTGRPPTPQSNGRSLASRDQSIFIDE